MNKDTTKELENIKSAIKAMYEVIHDIQVETGGDRWTSNRLMLDTCMENLFGKDWDKK